jgi:hypothetical protein
MYVVCVQSCRLTDEHKGRQKLSTNVLTQIPPTSSSKSVSTMDLEMNREQNKVSIKLCGKILILIKTQVY